jgi:hypothetical protein
VPGNSAMMLPCIAVDVLSLQVVVSWFVGRAIAKDNPRRRVYKGVYVLCVCASGGVGERGEGGGGGVPES